MFKHLGYRLQSDSSISSETKASSEYTYNSNNYIQDINKKQNWITENWSSVGESEIGIQTINSNSYFIEKIVVGSIKFDCCFKKYTNALKSLFIQSILGMDNLTKELHKEASVRVIVKCLDSVLNKQIRLFLEALKLNFEENQILIKQTNLAKEFVKPELIKPVEFFKDECNESAELLEPPYVTKLPESSSPFTLITESNRNFDKEGILLIFIINKIVLKEKRFLWKIILNYNECSLKESRLELLRNAKIKIKRCKFQIASNLVKTKITLNKMKLKQWAFYRIIGLSYTDADFDDGYVHSPSENAFPSGIIANIPFLDQKPFLELAIKSAINK